MRTQEEIAKILNVSTATVSRALNGKSGVSAATRQRVFELANEFLYKPNPVAQQLATAKSFAVAFVVKRHLVLWGSSFYDRIMMGAEQELERQGYHLIAITIDEELHSENALPPGLDPRRLDGLLIAGPELSGRMMTRLLSLQTPTVLVIGNYLANTPIDTVSSDNHTGAYQATRHLIEHGHRHIAYLSGPADWAPVRERREGYLQALYEVDLAPIIVVQPGLGTADGQRGLQELLARYPTTTAVLAVNDPVAIGVMRAAKELGRGIPNDLALIGYDNLPWTETTDPPLTTVYIHKQQMGKMAARRLLDIMKDDREPIAKILVENELVIRRSCGCK
jgi:DNA-binding LacI/PurR family transcriptional regulator